MAPSGTVTLLFTDIEGSTRAWDAHPAEMAVALGRHDRLLRAVIESWDGFVFKTVGDAFCVAFTDAAQAVAAAVEVQRAARTERWPEVTPIRVRMAVHSGACEERDGDYFGPPVNRVARLEATAHGGQIVVSGTTAGLVADRLTEGVALRDLGEHRLKDLGRPERVFQVCGSGLEDEFPPLRSLDNPQLLHNLPLQVSSFVGRHAELTEIRKLLTRSRLVTLTGPGGAGKTRLALHAAAELLDGSGDGVWLIELAPLDHPDLVGSTVASVLRVREEAGRPILETLVDALGSQRLLIIFDNCEHVIDAVAKLADAFLGFCPGVMLLATSRESLGISGEQVYRVSSLSLPLGNETDPELLSASEAVRLLVERATQHTPGFALDPSKALVTARVCRRLDGIPLAIELAAARLRTLSIDDLDQRLDQRFRLLTGGVRTALARQQTLHATIEWSWDLLTAAEQAVLARLAAFAGGWDLDAAEAVAAGGGIEDWEVLDHLSALIDKSLVQTDDTTGTIRYRLLETVREYADTELAERAENDAVRAAHRNHYLAVAETAAPHLVGHGQAQWIDRLELEHDNLRAALAHSLDGREVDVGLRLATALRPLWDGRGQAVEGIEILTALLCQPDTHATPLVRGRALAAVADLSTAVGNYSAATDSADEALALGRAECDDRLTAEALSTLSRARSRRDQLPDALAAADEGLAIARSLADDHLTARLLNARALALYQMADSAGARACSQEAHALYLRTGNCTYADRALVNVAVSELEAGELEAARANIARVLASARQGHDATTFWHAAVMAGLVEYLADDYPAACELFTEALTSARRFGGHSGVAYALLGLALATSRQEPKRAATIHGAADALLDQYGENFERLEADLYAVNHTYLRAQLGDFAYDAAYQAGRKLSRDDAIALALHSVPPDRGHSLAKHRRHREPND